jgi:hypothetical protein
MFHLYDQTRRRIGLAAFFLLCLAPTAAVLGWCVAWRLPGHARGQAESLSRQLGFDVAFDGLRHPRPGVVLYEGLKLSDPETGQTVLRCRALEATWTKTVETQGKGRPAIVLVASQPEVEASAADRLWQIAERALRGQYGRPEAELRLIAGELTIRAGEDSQTLTDVQAGIGISTGGTEAQAAFRLAGTETREPVRLRIERNRQVTPPRNRVELDTGGAEVPCRLLSLGLAELAALGPSSRFCGMVRVDQTSEGWEGDARAQLLGVDFDGLVSERFPHKLSGMADIQVTRAHFSRGRLEEAAGTIAAGPGVVGQSLLDAAALRLRMSRPSDSAAVPDLLPYTQLVLAFSLDGRGLRLEGRCESAGPAALMADGRTWLLRSESAEPLPVVALIQTLVPDNEIQVPATRQTDWLARRLPVPDVRQPRDAQRVPPHAPLRLRQ